MMVQERSRLHRLAKTGPRGVTEAGNLEIAECSARDGFGANSHAGKPRFVMLSLSLTA